MTRRLPVRRNSVLPLWPGRLIALALCCLLLVATAARAQTDPLPSWNEGPAKQAILAFVGATTEPSSPGYVPPEARIATFDQDGTTWVEQPMYTPMLYCLARLRELAKEKPELAEAEPFKSMLAGGLERLADASADDIGKLYAATMTGMPVEALGNQVRRWLETARDARWGRPYTELVYQPMLEVMQLLRAHGYKTYFVTGGGQDFLRAYAEKTYGVPPEQVVGTLNATKFGYDAAGQAFLTEEPKLLLVNVGPGKPQGIHLMIGRHPQAAFGNSDGDKEMLEYAQAGGGTPLMMLVRHDDAEREYAYAAQSKVGTFPDSLMAEAAQKGWVVISMKNDWKRIFSWE
ncbi:MAG: hypothetical protein B193_0260 [Solidesulfovibrio magneticus str. Maddingley MBC34]|uniref:Phosphoserine phosphatase n=1 Tax=Solidesulfovibrio magneticus str. Maddingley MBC34 TaxID=1206767 RepID=K6FR25_9BACT|nr:MAG: hypothetical protein B193_0260 [Solidesulfovibrio magneticus str. Maddingley MBC34]